MCGQDDEDDYLPIRSSQETMGRFREDYDSLPSEDALGLSPRHSPGSWRLDMNVRGRRPARRLIVRCLLKGGAVETLVFGGLSVHTTIAKVSELVWSPLAAHDTPA